MPPGIDCVGTIMMSMPSSESLETRGVERCLGVASLKAQVPASTTTATNNIRPRGMIVDFKFLSRKSCDDFQYELEDSNLLDL